MIRYTLLWAAVMGISIYAWKDWCRALCILIVMLAVFERPDMPKGILGIPGMNPFNLCFAFILAAAVVARQRERVKWDIPWYVVALIGVYMITIVVSFMRMATDSAGLAYMKLLQPDNDRSFNTLVIDYLINSLKWMMPGLLLMYGCRDEKRIRFAIYCLVALYALVALQVLNVMPLGYALDGAGLEEGAHRVLERRIGYHRVDLAMMLAGAPWMVLAARYLTSSNGVKFLLTALSGVVVLGLFMTGGRTGYVSCAAVGFVLAALRWRHYFLAAPAVVAIALLFLPGVSERMLQGINTDDAKMMQGSSVAGFVNTTSVDTDSVTSGRTKVWPYALAKVLESPWVGFGRRAHERTGVAEAVYWATKEFFGHPHNAYLEFAMDNGLILLALILCLYAIALYYSVKLFTDREHQLAGAVGGAATALMLAFLVGCFGAQTFYPILSTVGLWCAMGLSIRLWQQRAALGAPAAVATSLPSPIPSATASGWAPAALVLPSVASNSASSLRALPATGAQDLRPRGRYVQES